MTKPSLPGLYLIVDMADSASVLPALEAAIDALPVVSVLLREVAHQTNLPELIGSIQAHNVAVVIEDGAEHVETFRADGVHVSLSEVLQETDEKTALDTSLKLLNLGYIFGVGPHQSRHKLMQFAEQGVSYVDTVELARDVTLRGADYIALSPDLWHPQGRAAQDQLAALRSALETAVSERKSEET